MTGFLKKDKGNTFNKKGSMNLATLRHVSVDSIHKVPYL